MESPDSSVAAPRSWSFADRIDLEELLGEEELLRREKPAEFDARLRLDGEALAGLRKAPRSVRLRAWLERRRAREFPDGMSPGKVLAESRKWVGLLLGLFGAVLGLSMVGIAFGTLGAVQVDRPAINAPAFLVIALLPLLVSLVFAIVYFISITVRHVPSGGGFVSGVVGGLLSWISRKSAAHLPVAVASRIRSGLTGLRGQQVLFHWMVLSLAQRMPLAYAVFLIVGAVAGMLFWKQEFFWGSTFFGESSETMNSLVQTVALPWAGFLGEGIGYPSPETIRATAESSEAFRAGAGLVSAGWPGFVLAALVVYGLLPRVAFALLVGGLGATAIRNPEFSGVRYERLDERLLRQPPEWTHAEAEPESGGAVDVEITILEAPPETLDRVLAGRDLASEANGFQAPLVQLPLEENLQEPLAGTLLVLQEAFMPPTREMARQVEKVLSMAERDGRVVVGLLGKPLSGNARSDVSQQDLKVWAAVLSRIGDPRLALVGLGQRKGAGRET